MDIRAFAAQLKRRKVWQVMTIYATTSLLVIEAANNVLPRLTLPDWTVTFVVVLTILGFPIALALAWTYDITRDGIERTASSVEEPRTLSEAAVTPTAGLTPTDLLPVTGGVERRPAPTWLKVGGPVALVGIAAAVWFAVRAPTSPGGDGSSGAAVTALSAEEPDRLAVIPLENLTEDPDVDVWGELAAEWMGNAIDQAGPILVVPAATVRDAIKTLGAETAVTVVAERVRARYALTGTMAPTGDQVHFQLEFLDVGSGRRLRALDPVSGPTDSVEVVVNRLADVAAAAAVALLAPDAPPGTRKISLPPSLEAYREVLRQDQLFWQVRHEEAIQAGDRALEAAPDYVTALDGNYQAYAAMGRYKEADSILSRLEALRERMTSSERLRLDQALATSRGDLATASRIVEKRYRIAPTAVGYYAGLAAFLDRRLDDAVERLLDYDVDAPCSRDWPWSWVVLGDVYHLLGRYDDELDVARRGLERFPHDLRLMNLEARVFAATGRQDAVDSVLDAVAALPPQSELDPNTYTVLTALELRAHGHPEDAEEVLGRALAAYAAQPPDRNRLGRATALYAAGRWSDANALFADLIGDPEPFPSEGGVWVLEVEYRGHQGVILARLGRRREALQVDRWLAEHLDLSVPPYRGAPSVWRARIAAVLGEREDAVRHLQEALDRGFYWIQAHPDPAFDNMRGYPPWEALLAPR